MTARCGQPTPPVPVCDLPPPTTVTVIFQWSRRAQFLREESGVIGFGWSNKLRRLLHMLRLIAVAGRRNGTRKLWRRRFPQCKIVGVISLTGVK